MKSHIVAIVSAKGGVGKTTTAINLTQCLYEFGRSAILVDANYTKPNVGLHLGLTKLHAHINHSLKGQKPIQDAIYNAYSGIQVIPGSIIYEDTCSANSHKMKDLIDSLQGKYEAIFLDTAPSFGHELYDVLDIATEVIIVTSPDLSAITDALRTKKVCEEKLIPQLGVVVTHVNNATSEYSLQDIEQLFSLPVIGEIPFDTEIHSSIKQKQPLVFLNKKAKATYAYKKLAANIIGEEHEPYIEPNFKNYILRKLGFN